jgi:hypothetical protein
MMGRSKQSAVGSIDLLFPSVVLFLSPRWAKEKEQQQIEKYHAAAGKYSL